MIRTSVNWLNLPPIVTVSSLSTDHRSVALEVAALELSDGSKLYNSLDKAAALALLQQTLGIDEPF